jgi:predicted transcriptional regulator
VSDRFGSISGLLADRPERKPATIHPITPEGKGDPTPELKPAPQPRPATRKSRESTGGTRRVAFRLDPDLHTRLLARARQTNRSQGNVVLDAVEAAHTGGILTDLVAAEKKPPEPQAGLFARTAPRAAAQSSVPVEIQIRAQAVDQIDRLAKEHYADNRTQLITAALRNHLS